MSKLLHLLLDQDTKPLREARPYITPGVHTRRFDQRFRKPVGRPIIQAIREACKLNESITISPSEARSLLGLVENQSMADPFASGKSVLDDGDLKSLGLETNEEGEKYGLHDQKDFPKSVDGERDEGDLVNKQPVFGPESAIVAPDCTPGGRDDIPRSVLHSLKVLSGEDDVKEYRQEERPKEEKVDINPGQQMKYFSSQAEPEPKPQTPKQESAVSILKATKLLREGSRKQNSRKVIKKALTDEQRAAIAALSGPAD